MPAKGRKAKRGEISRERILQVATELFSQRGYVGAGVDHVAARSGIAKTAIYYHFGNKEGLLAAVLERMATEWIDRIEAISHEASDPIERLDRALAGMRALIEDRPWILRLFQIMALEMAEEKPEVRATLQMIGARAIQAIVKGLNDALHFDLPQAEVVARVILGLLNGIALGGQLNPETVNLDQAFDEVRRVTILLIASHANSALVPSLERQLQTRGTPVPLAEMHGPL